jgi:hypothetical protein
MCSSNFEVTSAPTAKLGPHPATYIPTPLLNHPFPLGMALAPAVEFHFNNPMATRNSKKRKLNETDLVPTELLSEANPAKRKET